jgi:outer membrane protein
MKNLSLILNSVLFVAVAVLYYLHFSPKKSSPSGEEISAPKDLNIAYINSDSVLKYYDYFKVNRDKLESKGKKLDQDLRNRAQSFQNDYEAYQRNVSNLTIGQAKAVEEDLAKKQQNLQLYQQSLSQEMSVEEGKMTQELYKRVTDHLKVYGEQNGLQIVLKYDPTSDVLFGGPGLDITKQVVEGLNKEYATEKESTPIKKDSVKSKKK